MRMWFGGAVVLALSVGVGCANRSDDASTPASGGAQAGGGAAAGAPAPAAGGGAAGAAAPQASQPAGARAGGAATQATAAKMAPDALDPIMKNIQQSVGSLQKNLKGNMLMEAAKDGQQLATLFGDVERFWQQHNVADAVKLAQTARTAASDAAGAAAAGDQMKAMAAVTTMFGTCKQCHTMYREGDQATGFRIRAGVIK